MEKSSGFFFYLAVVFRRWFMGELGLFFVLELLNCCKKEVFVTGNTVFGLEIEIDCVRK